MIANTLFHQCPLCFLKTEPFPVSDLHVVSVGVRNASLAWKNNGTASCRIFLEDTESQVNISVPKPGTQYKVTLYLLEPNGTRRELLVTESDSDATSTESTAPVSPVPVRLMTRDTEVLLLGLKPDTQYNATVYSQASEGTEGQPMAVAFRTGMMDFAKWF